MLSFLPGWLLGGISLCLLLLNTVFWCTPVYVVGLIRAAVPIEKVRGPCTRILTRLAEGWIDCNSALLGLIHRIEWDIDGLDALRPDESYLVSCNHQSWADIPILQRTFNHRIPFLRFFIKQELIRVPLLGLAWWFLDFPFMKRYSLATIEKHPELRGTDMATTRKACEKFRRMPVSILNFLEGTRFSAAKHARQNSPHRHLLRAKAGGMAFVLGAMGDSLHALLDVTIVYPDGAPDFWDFLSGRLTRVVVRAERRPLPTEFLAGNYLDDEAFRARFRAWVQQSWEEKDARIDKLLAG